MVFSEAKLLEIVAAFIWPLMRISAMFIAIPVFSIRSVPVRVRLILSVAVTLVVMPLLPPLPYLQMFSYTGLMVAIQQLAIGLMSGFILQMVFAAVIFGGQGVAYSMGLGFASMVDPQTGLQVPVVAQFYVVTTTLVFLLLDGHLLLIEMLLDSFNTIPIAVNGLEIVDIWSIIAWSSRIFAAGLLMALPVIASLLMINVSFGVATRAAPQLNIFSVGFPVTIILGLALMWLTLPNMLENFSGLLRESYDLIADLLRL